MPPQIRVDIVGKLGGGILGTISPAYGAATGDGLFGHMFTSLFGHDKQQGTQAAGGMPGAAAGPMPDDQQPIEAGKPSSSNPEYLTALLKNLGVYGKAT